jgi:ESCRT-II complex subunit VPS36
MFTSTIYSSSTDDVQKQMLWTPIDCCMGTTLTESGLLQRTKTEVELYTAVSTWTTGIGNQGDDGTKCTIELRSATSNVGNNNNNDNDVSMMVPLTLSGIVDTTKQSIHYRHRTTFPFQMTITTHRIVFIRDVPSTSTKVPTDSSIDNNNNDNNNNNQLVGKRREARYIHMSNVFSINTETSYFKSPKIILSTAIGELILAFYKGTNQSINPTKVRDECHTYIMNSYQRKQWDIDDEHETQKIIQRKMITNHKVGVDAIISASQQRHAHAKQVTDRVFDIQTGSDKNKKNQETNLETFLQEATELVQVIHKYVATLDRSITNNTNNNDPSDDTEKLVHMLQDMGMTSILNKTNYHNKRKKTTKNDPEDDVYYDTMARQIVDLIQPKLQRQAVPMITLTDVYCMYNRSRGTQLISPQDLLYAVERFQYLHLNLSLLTFPNSGLKVVQDPTRTNVNTLTNTFLSMCKDNEQEYHNEQQKTINVSSTTTTNVKLHYYGSITALSVSQKCGIPTVLALEQLQMVEQENGSLVRDETLEVVRFYPNIFFSAS